MRICWLKFVTCIFKKYFNKILDNLHWIQSVFLCCLDAWLPGFLNAWMLDCLDACLIFGCLVAWLLTLPLYFFYLFIFTSLLLTEGREDTQHGATVMFKPKFAPQVIRRLN
jgi:hypothetical protein